MNTQQRSVEAICDGTVIDHIPAGLGLVILRQFGLNDLGERVTVGFNLSSKNMGHKDIIKVENVRFDAAQTLTPQEKLQACQNLGVGNPDADLVAAYNAAKA